MKTLYEILEVSETASSEIIEKAYRVLVKKYHPDLQTQANKIKAESMMKEINEAYDILSNEQKRKQYDDELKQKRETEKAKTMQQQYQQQQYQPQYKQYQEPNMQRQTYSKTEYNKAQDMQRRRYEEQLRREEEKMRKQMQQNLQREYENAYYNYLRSLGYKIKERWTWKKTKTLIITIIVLIIVGIILWFLPPTHNMIMDFYESNPIIKTIVDIIGRIFNSLFNWIFQGNKS